MRLNDAKICRFEINQKDYKNNIKGFLNALLNSEYFHAELLLEKQYIIPAGFVKFTVDSGWVFANVSAKLSLGETKRENHLNVKIFDDVDKENPIIESDTEVRYTINENDVEAKLCFVVGSVFPYNGLKMVVPESRFVSLGTSNFPVKKLEEYEIMVTIGEPDPGTVDPEEPNPDAVDPEEPNPDAVDPEEPNPGTDPSQDEGADAGADAGEGIND